MESRGISEIKTIELSLCLLVAFIGRDRAHLFKGELAETSASWDSKKVVSVGSNLVDLDRFDWLE